MQTTDPSEESILNSSTEESIFHRAHSLSDLVARRKYLHLACGGDEALRRRIESLLEAAEHFGSFMHTPAVNAVVEKRCQELFPAALVGRAPVQIRQPERDTATTPSSTSFESSNGDAIGADVDSLIGHTLGHYRVDALIGSGGMAQVYLAEDVRLERRVALKIISQPWFNDRQPRFLREAQLASSLDHPNVCAIYDVGESAGHCFIAMQYIEGQTLEKLIDGRPVAIDELLAIALQVADALSAAHQRGFTHRDVKPRNIMVTARKQAIVLDFGLAKPIAREDSHATQFEGVVGTPAFMSPEQARGEVVDCRSDLFSLGAVLYHMATGAIPFRGASPSDVMRAVIAEPHKPPKTLNKNLPRELVAIIDRAMAKAPGERYQSAEEMASELRTIQAKLSLPNHPASLRARRQLWQAFAIAVVASLMLALAAFGWRSANIRWARQQVPAIEDLTRERRFFEAYELAKQVRSYLPDEPNLTRLLTRLLPTVSNSLSVTSDPPGARVYLRRFDPSLAEASPPRIFVGTTPLTELDIARGDYVISVEKQGHVPFRRTWSGMAIVGLDAPGNLSTAQLEAKLIPKEDARDGMVFVPGGDYRLVAMRRPIDKRVELDGYWIDQFEVTNHQYRQFVNADGYNNEKYWVHPFVKNGRTLSHKEAMQALTDRSGLNSPRGWSNQTYPEGKAHHPVVGITWYEAAAYAAFRGKSLPTIFQWEKAARNGARSPLGVIMPWGLHDGSIEGRANLGGSGSWPVGLLEFGMSPFGCYEMAGNVAEWCLNTTTTSEGYVAGGGSWASIPSAWGYFGIYPGFRSSDEVGFRCVVNRPDAAGDQGAMSIDISKEIPRFQPEPESQVKEYLTHYDYEQTPLDARIVKRSDTDAWRSEKIEYDGADGERALAYLYSPKNVPPPYQVLHVLPAGDVSFRHRTVPQSIEANYSEFVRSGRAVFAVVLKGNLERDRPSGWEQPDSDDIEFVDMMGAHVVDLRRGVDYLASRDDLDSDRLAYMSVSQIGTLMALPAIEPRYGAVVFVGDHVGQFDLRGHPATSGINFAPLISQPKLFVHGRYDESAPLKTAAEPLYNLLSEPKTMVVFEGGHRPDYEELAADVNAWLDAMLGPVQREYGRPK